MPSHPPEASLFNPPARLLVELGLSLGGERRHELRKTLVMIVNGLEMGPERKASRPEQPHQGRKRRLLSARLVCRNRLLGHAGSVRQLLLGQPGPVARCAQQT